MGVFLLHSIAHTHDINTSSLSDDYEKMEAIMNSTLKRTGLFISSSHKYTRLGLPLLYQRHAFIFFQLSLFFSLSYILHFFNVKTSFLFLFFLLFFSSQRAVRNALPFWRFVLARSGEERSTAATREKQRERGPKSRPERHMEFSSYLPYIGCIVCG